MPGSSDTDNRAQPASHNDAEQLRRTIAKLAHELAEALTAMNNYLHASQFLENPNDPASLARLHEAISKAIEQTNRAGEVAAQLRSIANGQGTNRNH